MTAYDAFEEKFAGTLHSSEMPSADFAARVMAQVVKTPQVKAGSPRRSWKIVLTTAACLVVACIAVPFVFFGTMRAGSAAPETADCAAPAEAPAACEEGVADNGIVNNFMLTTKDAEATYDAAAGARKEESESAAEQIHVSDTVLCAMAREILCEMGFSSDSGTYALTAEQTATLHQAMPELKLPVDACLLVLEG